MYIQREIKEKFEKIDKIYPVIALVGARQAGKTTFLKEEMKRLKASYLLFDDPDIRKLFEDDIKKFTTGLVVFSKVYGQNGSCSLLFPKAHLMIRKFRGTGNLQSTTKKEF